MVSCMSKGNMRGKIISSATLRYVMWDITNCKKNATCSAIVCMHATPKSIWEEKY